MESINKTPTLFHEPKESSALYHINENNEPTTQSGWADRIRSNTQLGIDVWGHGMTKEETRQVTKVLCASYELLEKLEQFITLSENNSITYKELEEARKLIFRIKNG
jgi:hypothetical protein